VYCVGVQRQIACLGHRRSLNVADLQDHIGVIRHRVASTRLNSAIATDTSTLHA